MGVFITIELALDRCRGLDSCGECVQVCPVTIFCADPPKVSVVTMEEDECTLCDLCLDKCPDDVIRVNRNYAISR